MFNLDELADNELFSLDDVASRCDGCIPARDALDAICDLSQITNRPYFYIERLKIVAAALFDIPSDARGPLVRAELLTRGLVSEQS